MDDKTKKSLLLYLLTITIGIIIVLLALIITNKIFESLSNAIGTGLISSGFVALLLLFINNEEDHKYMKIISTDRSTLDGKYKKRSYSAKEIDIIGIALSGVMNELATDESERLLKHILYENAKVRLMFLSPESEYTRQRALEDGVTEKDFLKGLNETLINTLKLYNRINKIYNSEYSKKSIKRDKMGTLEIKITDMCPHLTIYRTDNNIAWGLYTAASKGIYSTAMEVNNKQKKIFEELKKHFDRLWDNSLCYCNSENSLFKIYDPNGLIINENMYSKLLGADWRKYIE